MRLGPDDTAQLTDHQAQLGCRSCPIVGVRAEQGAATRARIVDVAAELFAADGFDATSIPAVLEATGLSRGALYHHFASKEALFEAVLERTESHIAERLLAASRRSKTPHAALVAGCNAFLRLAAEPAVAQIVLRDAPAVVGWARWREIDERHAFGLLQAGLAAVPTKKSVDPKLAAHVLLASLLELALTVDRSSKRGPSVREAERIVEELIAAFVQAA